MCLHGGRRGSGLVVRLRTTRVRGVASPSGLYTAGTSRKETYNLRRQPRAVGPADLSPPSPEPALGRTRRPRVAARPQPPPAVPAVAPAPPDAPPYPCPHCDRAFNTKSGLGLHRRRAHEAIFNEEINVERVRRQWNAEEQRMMAREEAKAVQRGVRFINQHLLAVVPNRTLEAIKGMRKNGEYRRLVTAALEDLAATSSDSSLLSCGGSSPSASPQSSAISAHGSPGSPPSTPSSPGWGEMYGSFAGAIGALIPVVEAIQGWNSPVLVLIGSDVLDGTRSAEAVGPWLSSVFPPTAPRVRPPRRTVVNPAKKARRRAEYARVQRLFRSQMSRVAKEILDGAPEADGSPDVRQMAAHWGPFVAQASVPVEEVPRPMPKRELLGTWSPISCEEVAATNLPLNSAPGLDGITVRLWRAVPASIKALLFNIVLHCGGFPAELLVSRTVFIPKKGECSRPGDFRPISITSVVVRHLHKILAQRLRESRVVDLRQRCFDDGCGENVAVLASLLSDARFRRREMHVASLDFAKAFDSVSHGAITNALAGLGLPRGLIDYVGQIYARSSTMFEVRGVRSELSKVGRGVRQGDPLSPVLFCLVIDVVMRAIPADVGYQLGEHRINSIAYADDVLLFAATRWGLQTLLRVVEDKAREMGLLFQGKKCSVLSLVPSGREKKIKIVTTPQFQLRDGSWLPQLDTAAEWRYLGVDFRPAGPRRVGSSISLYLSRLSRAPLKPQQRLKIVRCFLIPRLYHSLVLGKVTLGKLRALDIQTRAAVRKWLRLPKDVPTAFFHSPVSSGGLGIPALATTVPGLLYQRLRSLESSSAPQVQAIAQHIWVVRRREWARNALTRDGTCLASKHLRERWWSRRLYQSVDGYELRECQDSNLSSWWVDHGSHAIPGRDYVQHVHVRVNSLPTRIRTSRGIRRGLYATGCRAGCNSTETAAHVIQSCFRTHGGRVLRHNAVCKVLASGLRNAGWTVHEEPVYVTAEGKRKPDLLCLRDSRAVVLDAQVVSGATPLGDAHERKVRYYADNTSLREAISRESGVQQPDIGFSSCTISWRGIWCLASADWLLGMGLTAGLLRGITTRVLQGSHTNWTRWNQMTAVVFTGAGRRDREGIG